MPLPFRDLFVVELASVLAGPSVGQFFAELGAEVVKVENPRTGGDVTRRWRLPAEAPPGPEPEADVPFRDSRSAYFNAVNWGKRSLALDLTRPAGQALLHRLAARADLVVTSYRPGQARSLKADAATLQGLNPRLVVAGVTGYGPDDPRAGYDAVVQAEAGFTALNGPPGGPPTKMPVALVDVLAAHQLKEAILVALYERERTGRGAALEVSLLGAGVAALANQASGWLTAGVVPRRLGSAHPTIAPYGTPYPTASGEVVLAVGTDRQFAALLQVLKLDPDARFATNDGRLEHRDTLDALLLQALKRWDRDALLEALAAAGVPAGAVRDLPGVFGHPEAARLVLRAPGAGAVRTVAFRGSEDGDPPALAPPPAYAAHTAAVLGDHLGLDAGAVRALAEAGVVDLGP